MNSIMRLLTVAALAIAVVLAGCGQGGGPASPVGDTVHIVAGSELKDVGPTLIAGSKARGVDVAIDYAGTLDAIDRVNRGGSVDALWVANGAYARLALETPPAIMTRTMYSQVLIGVKPAVARRLGWDAKPPTWAEIAAVAAAGRLTYAMTNPTSSNTGMSALVSVATSIAGKGEGLAMSDAVAARIEGFLKGQAMTSGSSGWLIDTFSAHPGRIDAVIGYEASLAIVNRDHLIPGGLTIIYPADGAVTADYPLMLVNSAKKDAYAKLIAVLADPVMKTAIVSTGRRPPAGGKPITEVHADPAVDLPFPDRLETVDTLLVAYLDRLKRPSRSWFIIDRSGSMTGDRIARVQTSIRGLVDGDPATLTGRYARLTQRETVGLATFSTQVDAMHSYRIDKNEPAGRAALLADVAAIRADGGTAIFDALQKTLIAANEACAKDPAALCSVVLLTDGENNKGMRYEAFREWVAALPTSRPRVPVFTIMFGEGNADQMKAIAAMTGGKAFDARHDDLSAVFKDIRGYQ